MPTIDQIRAERARRRSSEASSQIQIPDAFRFLFEGSYRYRAAWGGRGSAKSHSFATALVHGARARPLRVLCCREIQNSIKDSVKRLLDDKIVACGYEQFFQSTDTQIKGANGSLFVFGGLRSNLLAPGPKPRLP